jgi:hypothetical protein
MTAPYRAARPRSFPAGSSRTSPKGMGPGDRGGRPLAAEDPTVGSGLTTSADIRRGDNGNRPVRDAISTCRAVNPPTLPVGHPTANVGRPGHFRRTSTPPPLGQDCPRMTQRLLPANRNKGFRSRPVGGTDSLDRPAPGALSGRTSPSCLRRPP